MKFLAQINKGELKLDDRAKFNEKVSTLKDGKYYLILQRPKSQRSLAQNRYLWVLYTHIGDYIGEPPEKVHEYLKKEFLKEHIFIVLNKEHQAGNHFDKIKSTTQLNTKEFSDYIEQIKRWASEFLDLYLPDADEVYE